MTVFVSLLRGVNVGGHGRIRMEPLRALCESLGLKGPQTLLQSGNVVFSSREKGSARLARRIEDGLENSFGFRPQVMVRTLAELKDAIARNPFAGRRGIDPSRLLVMFLAGIPDDEARARVPKLGAGPEEARLVGRELYLHYPDGIGRSKLSGALIERALGVAGTARNWNTVTRLVKLGESVPDG